MRSSWHHLFRRLAVGCAVGGGAAWSSAMCYAVQLAFDSADDPVYADGWQGRMVDAAGVAVKPTGDNGGFGFTQWDFTSVLTFAGMRYNYANPEFHAIDNGLQGGTHYSNPFNNIGRAWALGIAPTNAGVPRAGRGFSLGIGETLKVVIDNPTDLQYFKGYQINLNGGTGGTDGNICYGGVECVEYSGAVRKMSFATFEFNNSNGEWGLDDVGGFVSTGVFNTDTAVAGAEFSLKRTGTETYDVKFDSLGGGPDFMVSGRTFRNPGAEVDWIEFTFFNTPTDTGTPPTVATDMYIRSMEILSAAPPGVPGDYNNDGTVNAADYVVWRNGGPLQNEVSGVTPGVVTAEDYTAWRARFGNTAGAAAGSVSAAAVPEPGTFVVLVGACASLLGWRRTFASSKARSFVTHGVDGVGRIAKPWS